ncbi:CDT1-like protein a, chloroplastic [Vitis vinifera]|uniref:CDT1-like protein a, chloroplastic n=1 Tax=Vitis vinifera TaxID=29760 RepID=A0A438CMX9_VITVI|nr:CDT1-like protein a, chloroplastic [Vitis vinifera]
MGPIYSQNGLVRLDNGQDEEGLGNSIERPEKPREFCGGKSDLAAHTSVGFAPKTLVYLRLLRHHLQILTASLQLYCFYSPQTTMSASAFNPFKSKKIAKSSSKVDQTKAPDHDPWSSKTPEKPALPPRRAPVQSARTAPVGSARTASVDPVASPSRQKNVNRSMKLPEKYEMLAQFFDSLDSSIRLLRLKGSMSTFTNICPKIECLTDRYLEVLTWQLSSIEVHLPEAIVIKKVLMLDERTSCMKPDLLITLDVDGIENSKLESGNSHLRKIFRARLLDFAKAHPSAFTLQSHLVGDEIPEETLPEPFSQSKQDLHSNMIKDSYSSLPAETSCDVQMEQPQAVASHLSRCFQRRFSQKISGEAENSNKKPANFSLQLSDLPVQDPYLNKSSSNEEVVATVAPSPVKSSSPAHLPLSHPPATPLKKTDSTDNQDFPPKRCLMSPHDDSTNSPNKLVRRPARSRSLKFDTPVKGVEIKEEVNEKGSLSVDNDILDILPENLLESSINRSVVTKEELMHKILASHCDIVDRREVEEQLKLLQELVPEWISEKLASSGDLLLCIKKTSSPESIRQRLMEAK